MSDKSNPLSALTPLQYFVTQQNGTDRHLKMNFIPMIGKDYMSILYLVSHCLVR